MLPTKGYFQDIACPFYNTTCGRPYCHFRHRKRPNESIDDGVAETSKNLVPTYKPTPKSELANIQNSRSHIPISYVPDLSYNRERTVRPIKIHKPTYNPTPLSILSSATQPNAASTNDDKYHETIKGIQENIASTVYDPLQSEINFDDLTNDFDLIDNIIVTENDSDPEPASLNVLEHSIQKNLLQPNIDEDVVTVNITPKFSSDEEDVPSTKNILKAKSSDKVSVKNECEVDIRPDSTTCEINQSAKKLTEAKNSKDKQSAKSSRKEKDGSSNRNKDKSSTHSGKSKESKHSNKSSKYDKSREKHRKEENKNSSDKNREKHRKEENKNSSDSKSSRDKHKGESQDSGASSSKDSDLEKPAKEVKHSESLKSKKHKSKDRSNSRDRKREKRSKKSKSRSRSREKSASKHKSKKRSHSRSHDRSESSKKRKHDEEKSKSKEKIKEKVKGSHKKPSKEKLESDSDTSEHDQAFEPINMEVDSELLPSDIDLDLEDEDETLLECYKIFNEYKPETVRPQPKVQEQPIDIPEEVNHQGKKRKAHAGAEHVTTHSKFVPTITPPKPVLLPGQMLANRYKIAKMAQANNEQESIMNEVKTMTQEPARKPSLLEAARLHKLKRLQQQKLAEKANKPSANVVDDILNGINRSGASQVKIAPKKIAAVPNVALIEKAKQRISLIKKQTAQNVKTVAHSQKGNRVAHVPEYTMEDVPDVLQAEKSKLPVNVRTRFLTMIVEECCKLYALRDEAYSRALNEEFACYEKCKVLATYRNSAMLAVNRLRKEIQERESRGLGPLLSGESSLQKKESPFEGKTFYEHVKKWVLTDEELDLHGYPKESGHRGKAVISNRVQIQDYSITDDNQRKCSRCGKLYQVDDDGWPLFEEECMYHPLKKRTIRGEQIFLCCKSNDDTGCVTSDTHVFDGTENHMLEGFQTTLPPESDSDVRSTQVYALDCEMCYTTKGLELTRVTVVDVDCKTVYESLVKPLNAIIDYNTRFSGITKEQMDRTSTSILQVQANILHLCNSRTILVGHSLESDMKALKIVHGNVIDTSVLFPHKMGLPHKRALRALASEYLKKIIQNDVAGHDSAEDAIASMELVKWKLKEDLKVKTK